jgi:hypothetical protein
MTKPPLNPVCPTALPEDGTDAAPLTDEETEHKASF